MIIGRLPEDLEWFLNMPETLYVLRMNADGTDVAVEEQRNGGTGTCFTNNRSQQ